MVPSLPCCPMSRQWKKTLTEKLRTRINRIIKNKIPYCNIRFAFQTKCKVINIFIYKDKIPSFIHNSNVLLLFTNFSVVAAILPITGKIVKGDDDSAINEHLLFCNHAEDFEDFSILATNNNDFKVALMESLLILINRDLPPLNKSNQSLPLELF